MLLTIKQLQVKYGKQTALQIEQPISIEKEKGLALLDQMEQEKQH